MRNLFRLTALFLVATAAMALSYGAGFATALEVRGREAEMSGAARQAVSADNGGSNEAPSTSTEGDAPPNFGIFWEVWQHIDEEFYGEQPDDAEVTYGAIRGSLRALNDPYTAFTDPSDTEVSRPNLEGQFEGIGAFVTQTEEGQLMIQSPMPGQPAERAGILAGDIVIKVDDTDITGMAINDAVLLIRGPKGTMVTLTVIRDGEEEPLVFEVERDRIEIPSVDNVRLLEEEGAPDVGYLQLTEFAADTTDELQQELDRLRSDGAKALIIDLRNNPGGYLSTAIEVTSEFLASGAIVIQEDSSGNRRTEEARRGGRWTDLPLVVLVNKGSASASEILAGAIRDHERGTLVGATTFGKGSVQNVHALSDESQLRVTVAVWRTPDGQLIHKAGITPDIEVEFTAEDREAERDPQLYRAIEEARQLIGGA